MLPQKHMYTYILHKNLHVTIVMSQYQFIQKIKDMMTLLMPGGENAIKALSIIQALTTSLQSQKENHHIYSNQEMLLLNLIPHLKVSLNNCGHI